MNLNQLIEIINSKGWVAYRYPRLKKVSINGGKMLPDAEAIKYMKAMLQV